MKQNKKWRINRIFYVVVNPFLSMNCKPNFILIAIPDETRGNSWGQDTYKMLKYKEFLASIGKSNFLSLSGSCSSSDKSNLFLISNNEKWLSLNKYFWEIYHYSKCLARYYSFFLQLVPIFEKLDSKFKSFFTYLFLITLCNMPKDL